MDTERKVIWAIAFMFFIAGVMIIIISIKADNQRQEYTDFCQNICTEKEMDYITSTPTRCECADKETKELKEFGNAWRNENG